MGNLPIHIYGYNNEHDVIVYTVVKDTQSECGQPRHFGPFTLKRNPEVFKLKRGLQRFQKCVNDSVNNRRNRSKSYAF